MKLRQLTVSNFMPYKEQVSIDFPSDDARNVMIVFGDNMRGKTSLLNALRWGFYGRAVGRHSRPILLPDIVNRDAALQDDWRIDVFISFDANGHTYELRRSATRRGHVVTPTRPEDFIVSVHLTRDGSVVTGDQVEPEINQFAPEQVSRFFLFDGELLQEYEELLIEGSEQGRQIKEAIEQVLGVPALIHGRAELGALLRTATKRQSVEMAHIQGLERQAEQTTRLTARLDTFERDLEVLQGKLTKTKAERAGLEDELEGAATVLALKASLDGARASQRIHNETRERKRVERQALLALAWQDLLDARLEIKRGFLRTRQEALTEGLKERVRLQSQIDNTRKLLKTNECPTCGQALGSSRRDDLGRSLGTFESEMAKFGDETQELQEVSSQQNSWCKC
jgi:DNA sulfur modification protein DndD